MFPLPWAVRIVPLPSRQQRSLWSGLCSRERPCQPRPAPIYRLGKGVRLQAGLATEWPRIARRPTAMAHELVLGTCVQAIGRRSSVARASRWCGGSGVICTGVVSEATRRASALDRMVAECEATELMAHTGDKKVESARPKSPPSRYRDRILAIVAVVVVRPASRARQWQQRPFREPVARVERS